MSVTDFFDDLVATPPPALRRLSATIRFDLSDKTGVKHWLLNLDHGTIRVSHRKGRADAVIGAEQTLFERILSGRANAMAATLRGEISIEGDRELLVTVQRLMPGPVKG